MPLPLFLSVINSAVVLGVGGSRIMEGHMTVGTLVAFQGLLVSFMNPVIQLVNLGAGFQQAVGDMNRLDDVLGYEQDRQYATSDRCLLMDGSRVQLGGHHPLSLDDAWEAARMAGMEQDIKDMPMGMHTVIMEGASTLSGGQRQRLMIARAVADRPRILIFDEATSALDNRTQAVVSESLKNLKATRIVIAHRLSTIQDADCIHVISDGEIIESGTYSELIAKGGMFEKLARRQMV